MRELHTKIKQRDLYLLRNQITLCEELVKLQEKNLGELLLQGQHCGLHGRQGDLGSHPGLGGKSSPGSFLLVTGVQGELVKSVLCQTAFWRPHLAHVGEMVPQLLDELELLVQVVRLQEVAQVGVAALGGQVVQVEQALADSLLQVQGVLHGLEATLRLLGLGHPGVQEEDAASTLVLQEHQALGRLAVLLGAEQEEAEDVLQGHVVVVVQGAGPGQALEGGVELQGGATLGHGLALGTVVVARLPGRCGQHGGQRQDHPEGVSDEGGAAGAAAGAEVLAASSEPSHGDP